MVQFTSMILIAFLITLEPTAGRSLRGGSKTIICKTTNTTAACSAGTADCYDDSPVYCAQVKNAPLLTMAGLPMEAVLGAPVEISCPGGANRFCNHGTDGCFDNSPVLCSKFTVA